MKRQLWGLLLLTLLLVGCDDGLYSGTLISDGEHRFGAGTQLPGNVFMRAGTAELAAGAQAAGTLYMLGGSLTVNGAVAGDLALLGGSLTLGPQAVVGGDLRLGGGEVTWAETAVIHGDIISGSGVELPASMMASPQGWDDWLRGVSAALLLAGFGALLRRSRPQPVQRVGMAIVDNVLVCGAMGLLILLVLPALLVMMAFTIILIPLVIVLGALLLLLLGYGFIAVGYQAGAWLSRRFQWNTPPAAATFGGTLLLLLLFEIPVLGDGLLAGTAVLVLGAVLLTRLGTRSYVPDTVENGPSDLSDYARHKEAS